MLKNKIIVRKIRNIVILIMAMAIMVGAYRYIDRSRAEKVVEIGAIALDDYGYLEDEEITLEAKQVEDGFYEVELPDSINTKKINRIVKIGLGEFDGQNAVEADATQQTTQDATEGTTATPEAEALTAGTIVEDNLELLANRIYLTKEQVENKEEQINLEVEYDIAIVEEKEDGTFNKTLVAEKTEEERKQLETDGVLNGTTLYSKILRYEDEANNKLVELKGYLPLEAELQVEEVAKDKLTQIVGEEQATKVGVAYDIKILVKVVTVVPADEAADPNAQPEEIVETIEINPEDFGEKVEVSITDAKIAEKSQVYHVNEDNTVEQVNVKDNSTEGNVSFEADTFSIYYTVAEDETATEGTGDTTTEAGDGTETTVPGDVVVGATQTWEVKNLTKDGFDVYLYGVTASEVRFPTWTDVNGQDDIDWIVGTNLGNGTWYARVNISQHNYEGGTYITHIYSYDASGNDTFLIDIYTFVDIIAPTWSTQNINTEQENKKITLELVGTDESSGLESHTLNQEQLSVYADETKIEAVEISVGEVVTDDEAGTVTYPVTVEILEEALSGKIKIEVAANSLIDKAGNASVKETFALVDIDEVGPEFTYTYAAADINRTNETVTIKFSVADKFYDDDVNDDGVSDGPMDFDDFTILVDGVEPGWYTPDIPETGGFIRRTLTSEKIEETRNGETVTVGYTYTVVLSNLQTPIFRDGYRYSGVISIAISEGKVQDTTGNTNLAQTITMGIDMPEAGLPSTEHSTPYLPDGYTYVTGTINTGIVIRDAVGNEYVWIDIPRNSNVYTETTLAYDLDTLTGTDLTNALNTIETELRTYTTDYTEEGLEDVCLGDDEQYAELKQKMLKSIFQNGGFYIARNEETFEEGITIEQAQQQATAYAESLEGYTSSLMFGLQHNLLLKSLETKGITREYLTEHDTAYNINNLSGDIGFRVMLISESKETAGENDEVIVDFVKPAWSVYTNVNQIKKQVDVDLSIKDKYFKQANLTTNNIKIYIDGEDISSSNINKKLSSPVPITEKRIVDGVQQDVQVGLKYTLTLSNWEELTRRNEKLYKEYGGYVTIVIDGGLATDQYGNTSWEQSLDLGLIDVIKPEYTYKYSEADINHNLKTVKIVFSIADKYLEQYEEANIPLKDVNDLKILIDGKEPVWKAADAAEDAQGVKKTLTYVPITENRNGVSYTVGYTYTLLLEELEQDEKTGGKNYLDYSGVVTVGIPRDKIYDTTGNANPAQTITLGIDITGNTGGQVEEEDNVEGESGVTVTGQYMPQNFTQVDSDGDGDLYDELDNGLVIQDEDGNQYVWVEVPKTTEVYKTAGVNVTEFTDEVYELIEDDLHEYTMTYRTDAEGNETTFVDEYSSEEATGLTKGEYYLQKKKMLKSIYKNEGFYVGRYETGIENSYRTAAGTATQVPVIQQHAYPYNYVANSQAQTLSETFADDLNGYTSSLMFGVQYDLMLKYLETKGTEVNQIISDSTSWGNYSCTYYNITNSNAKYSNDWGVSYHPMPCNKTGLAAIILTTGSDKKFSKQNIYDIAGNMWEVTLEYSLVNTESGVFRGESFGSVGDVGDSFASIRSCASSNDGGIANGFRTALYKDEGVGADSSAKAPKYIPNGYEHVAGTTMQNGYVIKDNDGNEFVWVEVPRTAEIYGDRDAEGNIAGEGILATDIDSLTGDAFTAAINTIEEKLHDYTMTYRTDASGNETAYTDTHSGNDATTGLSNKEYTLLKQKMLKSIFKNEGFYIARYETGTATQRTAGGNIEAYQPVIKQNVYPYNYVTTAEAQSLAQDFATDGYETNLMFGVQWDLALKYLETKGASVAELDEDSTSWGNYTGSQAANTGSNNTYAKQNISDLAGNVWEMTLENTNDASKPNAVRAGAYDTTAESGAQAASARDAITHTQSQENTGFRVSLFRDEGASGTTGQVADVVDPLVEIDPDSVVIDKDNQKVTMDIKVTDKYFDTEAMAAALAGDATNGDNAILAADEIKIFGGETTTNADGTTSGTEITQIVKTLSEPEILTETQKINGVDTEVQYGVKYTLTLTNWQAAYRAGGKLYKEWSGDTSVVVTKGAIIDQNTNGNKEVTHDFGHVDFVRPEFTYNYAAADINKENETVTIQFSVADKFYDDDVNDDGVSDGPMDFEDFTILVDGEVIYFEDMPGVQGDTAERTLTTQKITETRNGQTVTIGYTYTIVLKDLGYGPQGEAKSMRILERRIYDRNTCWKSARYIRKYEFSPNNNNRN